MLILALVGCAQPEAQRDPDLLPEWLANREWEGEVAGTMTEGDAEPVATTTTVHIRTTDAEIYLSYPGETDGFELPFRESYVEVMGGDENWDNNEYTYSVRGYTTTSGDETGTLTVTITMDMKISRGDEPDTVDYYMSSDNEMSTTGAFEGLVPGSATSLSEGTLTRI